MKNIKVATALMLLILFSASYAQDYNQTKTLEIDKIQALKDTLVAMQKQTNNLLFINSCKWFTNVIEAQTTLTKHDSIVLSATYDTFCLNPTIGNCREYTSYLNRERPLIIAWQSATDGKTSMAALILPKDWDPEKAYPLYINLHGLSSTTNLPMDFLTRYYLKPANQSFSYEDGYLLSPWGRGNLWYQGISETDIWECKKAFEEMVNIDETRQYIKGHSMGGYGAWYIASKSNGTWAALGNQAGALWYNSETLLNDNVIQELKDLPTYFVVGTNDGLLNVNQRAYNLLNQAGNENTKFVTFEGGHEHLDSNEELMYLWMKAFTNTDYTSINENDSQNILRVDSYPNPFSKSVSIRFLVNEPNHVKLLVYSIDGKLLKTLANNNFEKGQHTIKFEPETPFSGLFFYKLQIGNQQPTSGILVRVP